MDRVRAPLGAMASRLRAQITSMGENIVNRFSILDVGPVEDEKAGASRSSGRNKEKRTGGKRGEADNAGSLAAGDASSALHFPLVWIDLEMTGLDVANDTIMEIAVIVTDGKLEKEVEGPNLVIQHTDTQLASMNDWCIDQHGRSGLTQVRDGGERATYAGYGPCQESTARRLPMPTLVNA